MPFILSLKQTGKNIYKLNSYSFITLKHHQYKPIFLKTITPRFPKQTGPAQSSSRDKHRAQGNTPKHQFNSKATALLPRTPQDYLRTNNQTIRRKKREGGDAFYRTALRALVNVY